MSTTHISAFLVHGVDLARLLIREVVGWGNTPNEPSFGGGQNDAASVKGKLVNLISSVRTLMRSKCILRINRKAAKLDAM